MSSNDTLKVVAQKCPCCGAPLDLNLDAQSIDVCEFCNSRLHVSRVTENAAPAVSKPAGNLTANKTKSCMPRGVVSSANSMDGICRETIDKEKPDVCFETLNKDRTAVPIPILPPPPKKTLLQRIIDELK
jgi:hypothetical protein